MHPLVRDLYKRAITVGKDYPHPKGLDYVRETWKRALRDNRNFDVTKATIWDPLRYDKEIRKAVGKGRYAIREMIGVIQLKKYRALKERYGVVHDTNIDMETKRIKKTCQDLLSSSNNGSR
mmetsp:Transcript_3980/g.7643  ORF Transcript_3980/g.7643 Transcript_3980/m.7643 type:complete len:121 (+) Transcript_3980:1073-1435(+)